MFGFVQAVFLAFVLYEAPPTNVKDRLSSPCTPGLNLILYEISLIFAGLFKDNRIFQ